MRFILHFAPTAKRSLKQLKEASSFKKQFKAVTKTLKLLQENPRHPGLQTHKYHSFKGPKGENVFTVYAEQNTPAALTRPPKVGPLFVIE